MRRELGLLNIICLLVVLGFVVMALISVLSSGDFLTIDNLFIITVSLVMALMFAVPVLMYLNSQGKLPIPFVKRTPSLPAADPSAPLKFKSAVTTPPLLDAKGRAVPPDVKALMTRLKQTEAKDA